MLRKNGISWQRKTEKELRKNLFKLNHDADWFLCEGNFDGELKAQRAHGMKKESIYKHNFEMPTS